MKWTTGRIVLVAVVAIVLIFLLWLWGSYNSLVSADEGLGEKWGNVQSVYQRRADLIPNLVATVQGAANFEKETQTKIAELRTDANTAKMAVSNAKTPSQLQAANVKVDSVYEDYKSLNINVENYPQLKATENFLSLQDQIEGTENRITVARNEYNDVVKKYYVLVRRVPTNLVVGWFGFTTKEMFEAEVGSDKAPDDVFE